MLLALLAAGCGPPVEYPILQRFFAASRLRDTVALHEIATIVFEPREQGTVSRFDITRIDPRREGNRELKDITVSAVVRLPTRQSVRRSLVLTMELTDGRWMIIACRPVN